MSSLTHIAFIPDGNRRWAKGQGLPSLEGHRKGYERIKEVVGWCRHHDIKEVSFWGFSTENWKRSKQEVKYLFGLMEQFLIKEEAFLKEQGIRVRVIGRREDLPMRLQKRIAKVEEATAGMEGLTLNVLFNYGGRAELLAAVRTMREDGVDPDRLTEEVFRSYLWSGEMSDPDLIVRTSGECRLSGFLPWTGVYSELYFTNCHWPDFDESEFNKALSDYQQRERRFGGDSQSV